MSCLRRVLLAVAGAVVVLVATATPAFAHAVLEGTSPADGTRYPVSAPPTFVSMHFGESVGVKLGAVRVYDEHGRLLDTGKPSHPGSDGSTVRASLPKLGAGTYVVTWRVISADTHPVGGAFTFIVGSQPSNVAKLETRLLSSANGSRSVGILYGVLRFGLFASLIVLLGGAAFIALAWRAGRQSDRARRILWIAWWTALAVTVLGFAVEGIYAAAFPLRDLLNTTVLSDTLHARYGETALARTALLLIAVPLLRVLTRRPDPEPDREARLPVWWSLAAVVVALGTVVTVTLASHGTTGRWTGLAIPADALHVSAVSLWLGGLFMLTFAVVPRASAETLDRITPRYSNLALGAVMAIVVSGLFQATRQVGTIHALLNTDYGHLLIAKLVAFSLLIGFAVFSRQIVDDWYVPRKERMDRLERDARAPTDVAGTVRSSTGEPPVLATSTAGGGVSLAERPPTPRPEEHYADAVTARRRLTRTIRAEVAIAVVVLILTALLVDARPAYEVANGPQNLTLKSSTIWFQLEVTPAKSGLNQVHLSTETPTGGVANPLQVTMEITNKSHAVGPLQVPLIAAGPGHKINNNYQIPFAGTWQVVLRALTSPVDEAAAYGNITIR